MLTSLRLEDFKGFRDATLRLGSLSLVIGANASGKSNLRDALRFLHGVARGYNLAEILGEKYGEGGYREWSGIRGGVREVCREGTSEFTLTAEFQPQLTSLSNVPHQLVYSITVGVGKGSYLPRVQKESLRYPGGSVFEAKPNAPAITRDDNAWPLIFTLAQPEGYNHLIQQAGEEAKKSGLLNVLEATLKEFESMRFLDLSPEGMRRPSIPGQTILSDQGENLSSVLQAICGDAKNKERLARAIEELTPMDVADFDFVADAQGKVLVYLIEKDGRRISAYSASDGTLRFLGILAALLGPKPAKFYFLDELETGIHPAQLYLLLDHLKARVRKGGLQILATTHSPQLLRLLDEKEFANSALTYRVEGVPEARIRALPDVPSLVEVLQNTDGDIGPLHQEGWMERTMFYEEGEPEPFELDPVEGMPA